MFYSKQMKNIICYILNIIYSICDKYINIVYIIYFIYITNIIYIENIIYILNTYIIYIY